MTDNRPSNPRSLHFAEMLDRAETFSDRERGELADLLRAMTFESGEAETCIERLTRELKVQKAVNDLAYIPHRNLVESRDGLQKRYDKAEAERDRLRAALDELMRLAGVQTRHSTHYEGCADDHAWCKAFCIAQGALSNNALSERSQSPSETTANPMKYFRTPLRFVEPVSDSDANGPHIVDADGGIVAKLFWPCHPVDETEAAEQETYALGRAMAAARP